MIYGSNGGRRPPQVAYVPMVNYAKDLSIDALITMENKKSEAKSKNLADIEKKLVEYQSVQDDVLGMEVGSKWQKEILDKRRAVYGIDDNSLSNVTYDMLSNTPIVSSLKDKASKFGKDFMVKSVIEDQAKLKKYSDETDAIYAVNPALGLLAKEEMLNYMNSDERSYLGFPLSSAAFKPVDVQGEIKKIVDDLPKDYSFVVDPNEVSGYKVIEKSSQRRVSGDAASLVQSKVGELRRSEVFNNNVKAIMGANGYAMDDESAVNNWINQMVAANNPKITEDANLKEKSDRDLGVGSYAPKVPKVSRSSSGGGGGRNGGGGNPLTQNMWPYLGEGEPTAEHKNNANEARAISNTYPEYDYSKTANPGKVTESGGKVYYDGKPLPLLTEQGGGDVRERKEKIPNYFIDGFGPEFKDI